MRAIAFKDSLSRHVSWRSRISSFLESKRCKVSLTLVLRNCTFMLATRSPGVAPPLQQMLQSGYRLPTRPLFLGEFAHTSWTDGWCLCNWHKDLRSFASFACHVSDFVTEILRRIFRSNCIRRLSLIFSPSHFFLIILGKCALRKHRRQMNCFTTPWHLGAKGHIISTGACPFKLPLSSCMFLATRAFLLAMEGIFIEVPDGRPLEYRKSSFGFLGWTLRQWSNRTCQSLLFWPYNAALQCLHFQVGFSSGVSGCHLLMRTNLCMLSGCQCLRCCSFLKVIKWLNISK